MSERIPDRKCRPPVYLVQTQCPLKNLCLSLSWKSCPLPLVGRSVLTHWLFPVLINISERIYIVRTIWILFCILWNQNWRYSMPFLQTLRRLSRFLWSLTLFVVVINCTVVRLSLVLAKHIQYNTNVNSLCLNCLEDSSVSHDSISTTSISCVIKSISTINCIRRCPITNKCHITSLVVKWCLLQDCSNYFKCSCYVMWSRIKTIYSIYVE